MLCNFQHIGPSKCLIRFILKHFIFGESDRKWCYVFNFVHHVYGQYIDIGLILFMFTLYPVTLRNSPTNSRRGFYFFAFGGIFLHRQSCYLKMGAKFYIFLSNLYAFYILLFCLTAVARTSSPLLSCESKYPCLVPSFRGNALSLTP